ncbi:M48 family metalloprotease [Polaribacter porphyrae]|uniref:Peptidase M48 domain-containing protein n=1 Tax=Polaribacter porphyrae TaxID=1137780 RepID=A0A2S7WMW7_9FLAO|nr:M48 family metalloprotease [Polaribacter porphyrae]PQJ78929.1 hypothetical protein BTO18_06935 [Polaribacter porphyrae]
MFRKIIFGILFLISSTNYSQELRIIDTATYSLRKEIIKENETQNTLFYKNLKKLYRGKKRKEITKLYKSSDDEFISTIKKNRFVFDKRFTKYTDSIVNVVIGNNDDLKNLELDVYISKNPSVNAINIGKGKIILNIGLFKYLQNEDQLISILSHEIAHEKLQHVNNNIIHIAELQTSKKRKEQARKIRKQKYNKYNSSFKILKNLMYSDSKKRRKREMQADSLGYLFFKKTALYNPNYLSALKLLAKFETLPTIELDSTIYKTFFDIPNQPFKEAWLKMEEFSDYDYSKYKEKINKDSIKSHPEYQERIDKLQKDFSELNLKDSIHKNNNANFIELQKIAKTQDIVSFFDIEENGLSIKLILYKLSKDNDNPYLKKWLGKNFLALYEAKKKYRLNRYVDRLNPKEQSKNYQQFLSFIWNLSLDEIKNIGDYYSKD